MASSITPDQIAKVIGDAPGWALVALTVPHERLRADGRREVARHVHSALFEGPSTDPSQLVLPL